MTGKIDIVGEGAKRKFGLPAEWVIFRWEAKNGFFVLTGAVCTETHKVGKRNGHLNWAKLDKATEMPITISESDRDTFLADYERATGNCHVCQGSGQQAWGWSSTDGTRYRPCPRCRATGTAEAHASVELGEEGH